VQFDDELIKNCQQAAALLHTFAAVGKSMSVNPPKADTETLGSFLCGPKKASR